jgi:acyl carrier protein
MLTFEQFRDRLAGALEIGSESLTADVSFIEDLAFDSLRMLTLATLFEELDVDMPAELAWDIRTLGDAYAYYVGQREARAASPR